jgi:hypothetical protein
MEGNPSFIKGLGKGEALNKKGAEPPGGEGRVNMVTQKSIIFCDHI